MYAACRGAFLDVGRKRRILSCPSTGIDVSHGDARLGTCMYSILVRSSLLHRPRGVPKHRVQRERFVCLFVAGRVLEQR